jgi:heme exporter protein D
MMDATNHLAFIVASYAAAVVIIGGLTAWIALDYRVQRRTLIDLDMRGVTRRSTTARAERTMAQAKEEA